ncbi:MAG TPA: phenylacetate--CoA ligase family protein [Firmicutes bacterium]|nr:phenylacetate--CoA ligase family protein [Bacillota bacterium]
MYWKNWDRIEWKEARERQGAILHRFLKEQVIPFSPYYRELLKKEGLTADDIRSISDLRKIPFTRKDDITPKPDEPGRPRQFILQPDPETYSKEIGFAKKAGLLYEKIKSGRDLKDIVMDEYLPIMLISTTGRSAAPVPFIYTRHDYRLFREAARRLFELTGLIRGKDTVVNIFPYAPHLAFWIVSEAGLQAGAMILHTGGGKVMGTEKIIHSIENLKASFVVGIPGYVYHVLRTASEKNRDFSSVRMVVLGAERVNAGLKRKLAGFLESMGSKNPAILSTYGFTEARTAWIECPTDDTINKSTGYHLYPDLEIFEIVDPETGEEVPEGESGEVAYTSLDWRGTVVLRYLNGDYARGGIVTSRCPSCGRLAPRLTTDLTRQTDVNELKVMSKVQKVKGTLVDFNEFFPILSELTDVVEWQVEITKRNEDPHDLDEIHLHIAVDEKCDQWDLTQLIKSRMFELMEISPTDVHFRSVAEMTERLGMETSSKEKRIYDRRPEIMAREGDQ